MQKQLEKHFKKKHFVKIYIADKNGTVITNFDGIILGHNKAFVMLLDTRDFSHDGQVVIRKKDIYEIKRSKNEKFIQKVLEKEHLLPALLKNTIPLKLTNLKEMFESIKQQNLPVIVESCYGSDDIFQIGPVHSVNSKQVKINYFNSHGKYDLKPVSSKLKQITFLRIGFDYSTLYYKYSKRIK